MRTHAFEAHLNTCASNAGDAPKLILTCKLQPCTTGEKSKHEEVEDLCPSVCLSVGVTDPVPAKPQVSHDVRESVSLRTCCQIHIRWLPYSKAVCTTTEEVES